MSYQQSCHPGDELKGIPRKLLKLLQGTNGGVVTMALIERVCWPGGNMPKGGIAPYISAIRNATGLGIISHVQVGYKLDPALDQPWTKKNPAG